MAVAAIVCARPIRIRATRSTVHQHRITRRPSQPQPRPPRWRLGHRKRLPTIICIPPPTVPIRVRTRTGCSTTTILNISIRITQRQSPVRRCTAPQQVHWHIAIKKWISFNRQRCTDGQVTNSWAGRHPITIIIIIKTSKFSTNSSSPPFLFSLPLVLLFVCCVCLEACGRTV